MGRGNFLSPTKGSTSGEWARVSQKGPACLINFSPTGLVKAVNTAVDLIVAHFGTSRDPGVKVC